MGLKDRQQVTLKWVSNNTDHPDVADGAELKLFGSEVRETFDKDIKYIQRPKTDSNHYQGPETLAQDLLKEEHVWNLTARVLGKESEEDLWTLPESVRDSNNDGEVTDQNLSFGSFATQDTNNWVLLGATKIEYNSEIVRNEAGDLLAKGTDYEIDYNRGRIQLFNTSNTTLGETYTISYTYEGSNDNIARVLTRMAQRGGNAILTYDKNTYTTDGNSEEGSQYMVQINSTEWQASPSQPDLVEITFELRVAFDRGAK